MMKNSMMVLVVTTLMACQSTTQRQVDKSISAMPEAVSNNAVALVQHDGVTQLFSFNGLSSGKTWADVHNRAYHYDGQRWQTLSMPDGAKKVLASTAVSMGEMIYVIGGYTVAQNHEEKSVNEIFRYDTRQQQWRLETTMPVPVDDTVALVYANRYIYLVSGWHDVDNVSRVQVYDVQQRQWFTATDYPAPAVFGHAGGIANDTMVICDGVKVVKTASKKQYAPSVVCMKGTINASDPARIEWQTIEHHSSVAYYRMAAIGNGQTGQIIFAGGSDNPYNYNGIGYNDVPSEASSHISVYDLASDDWLHFSNLISPSMDHRAMLYDGQHYYILGGMRSNQMVSDLISTFKLPQ